MNDCRAAGMLVLPCDLGPPVHGLVKAKCKANIDARARSARSVAQPRLSRLLVR